MSSYSNMNDTNKCVCNICSTDYSKLQNIKCVECNKSVCGACYNKIRTPLICDETTELTSKYKCPFCRTNNDIEIKKLDKEELTLLINKEFSIWEIEKNEREEMRMKNINLKYENNNLRKALELKSDYDKQSKGIYTETDYYNQAFIAVNNQVDRLQTENIKLNERNDILLKYLDDRREAENENIYLKYKLKAQEDNTQYLQNILNITQQIQEEIREIATSNKSLKAKVKAIETLNNNINNSYRKVEIKLTLTPSN
jgi:hypothetical protein